MEAGVEAPCERRRRVLPRFFHRLLPGQQRRATMRRGRLVQGPEPYCRSGFERLFEFSLGHMSTRLGQQDSASGRERLGHLREEAVSVWQFVHDRQRRNETDLPRKVTYP